MTPSTSENHSSHDAETVITGQSLPTIDRCGPKASSPCRSAIEGVGILGPRCHPRG